MNAADVPTELFHAFEVQRTSFDAAPFPDWEVRRDRLARLRRLVEDNEVAIEDAIHADFGGRPRTETQIAEVFPSLGEIKVRAAQGPQVDAAPQRGRLDLVPAGARAHPAAAAGRRRHRRSRGTIRCTWPSARWSLRWSPGNRALVKMSEFTPAFSALFEQLVAKTFAPDEVAVVNGGPDVAAQFTRLPFNHLFFTGSTLVGRKVMGAAAENLTPVTLELGGKSPTVIAPGYPLEKAAQRILAGKLLNAGQTCIAPDYVLRARDALAGFVEATRHQAKRMYPAGLDDPDFCSIINQRQYGRLVGYVDEARAGGVEVVPLFEGRIAGRRAAPPRAGGRRRSRRGASP